MILETTYPDPKSSWTASRARKTEMGLGAERPDGAFMGPTSFARLLAQFKD